jgi:hypothetical protein
MRPLKNSFALLLASITIGVSTPAQAVEHHFGIWTAAFMQGKFSENWGWFFENQVRLHHGWDFGQSPDSLETRANRLLVRPAIRWLPRGDNSLQVHFGYGWTPNFSPERMESRLWQQLQLMDGDPVASWQILHRFRMEQRHIEFTQGLSHRARYMGRAMHFFGGSANYGVVLWDELFWNLNTLSGGPAGGFDQNRIFVGPVAQVSPGTRIELGYLNVYYAKGTARQPMMTHTLGTFVFFELP